MFSPHRNTFSTRKRLDWYHRVSYSIWSLLN